MTKNNEELNELYNALTNTTRARLFLEFYWYGEMSGAELARRLTLPSANVYYHLNILVKIGLIQLKRIDHGSHFSQKTYELAPTYLNDFNVHHFNKAILEGEPTLRRNVTTAICTLTAIQLRWLAEQYETMDPLDFDELFFVQHEGVIGSLLTTLSTSTAFQQELRALIGKYADSLADTQTPDGIIIFGVLPFREPPDQK